MCYLREEERQTMNKLMWLISYSLYVVGDAWSRVFAIVDYMSVTYPAYNQIMNWSIQLDEKYNLGVWDDVPHIVSEGDVYEKR